MLPFASAVTRTGPRAVAPSPDMAIVPFTSKLPACASACGDLFNVQGGCIPPVQPVNQSCFCDDSRLKPFLQGTSGVESVCGAASCQDTADLQTVENWYESYCGSKSTTPTTTTTSGAAAATSTAASAPGSKENTQPQTWIQSHYGWVIFLVVVTVAIVGGWILASYFRRRYLRKKEREFEMRPPLALGPHQMQAMTGGFNSSEVALSSGRGGTASPALQEVKPMDATTTPLSPNGRGNRESRGWLTKGRQ